MFDQVLKKKKSIMEYLQSLGIPTKNVHNEEMMMLAFVHKSYAADFKDVFTHNERLEFVGDGILWAVINKLLFLNHPKMAESDLTLYKIALVREEILAEIARDIKLNEKVFISKWEEKTQWRQKDSILSDTLEAVIWYVYIDIGTEAAEAFIQRYVYSKLESIEKKPVKSYKTMIQEIVQKKHKIIPEYRDIEFMKDEKGNVTEYKSEIYVMGKKIGEGFGSNKKKAQEDGAMNSYEAMKK